MSVNSTARPASLLDTAQGVGATVLRAVHTRLELAAVDLQRERDAMLRRLTMLVIALFSGAFGLLLAAGWVVMAVAESMRLQVLGGMALAFLVLAAVSAYLMRSDALNGGSFMASTLGVLSDDLEALSHPSTRKAPADASAASAP